MRKYVEKIFTTSLNVRPLEKILIVTDTKMLKIAKVFYEVAKEFSDQSYLISMKPRKRDGEEPEEKISKAMKNSDIIIAITSKSLTHTKAVMNAYKSGARAIVSMPNISKYSITKGGLTANYYKVKRLCEKIKKEVKNSRKVEIFSSNGTELKFLVTNRKWYEDLGIFDEDHRIGNLPAGEIFVAPLEKSINGRIVFDFFEKEKNVYLYVKEGRVTETNSKYLKRVFKQLGNKARQIAEFGIGCNPKAKVIGNTLEDEKVLGTVHIALGSNIGFGGKNKVAFHKDGIIVKPTLLIDNKILIENGKWKF